MAKIEKIKNFFGEEIFSDKDIKELTTRNYSLRSLLLMIAAEDYASITNIGLLEGTVEDLKRLNLDLSTLSQRLVAAGIKPSTAQEICSDVETAIRKRKEQISKQVPRVARQDPTYGSTNPPFDPEIRRQCQQFVSEVNQLEEDIAKLESQEQTDATRELIQNRIEEIDKRLSFLYQEKSIQNMELRDEQRALLGAKFAGSFTKANEGLPSASLLVFRTRKVIELLTIISDAPKLIVNSPPYSGKTSMAELLRFYLTVIRGKTVLSIECGLVRSEVKPTLELLLSAGLSQHKQALVKLSKNSHPSDAELTSSLNEFIFERDDIDLIVDDGQRTYGAQDFWNAIKTKRSKRTFCFSSYSINSVGGFCTPMIFDAKLPISFLLFTQEEINNISENFINLTKTRLPSEQWDKSVEMIKSQKEELYRLTSGYPGLVQHGFRLLAIEYPKEDDHQFSKFDFYQKLTHPSSARCFKSIKQIEEVAISKHMHLERFNKETAKLIIRKCLDKLITFRRLTRVSLIERVLENSDNQVMLNGLCEELVDCMVRLCVIYENKDNELQFAIPLFEFFYMRELCSILYSNASTPLKSHHINRPELFVIKLVKAFDKHRLAACKTISTAQNDSKRGAHLEYVYDRLMYYSLCSLNIKSIYPQFQSRNLKNVTKGRIDYYINSNFNCGIEIIAGGDDFFGHCERVDPVIGKYRHLKCNKYILIDFYEDFQGTDLLKTKERVQQTGIKDYFIVQFDNDYNSAKVTIFEDNEPREVQVELSKDIRYEFDLSFGHLQEEKAIEQELD